MLALPPIYNNPLLRAYLRGIETCLYFHQKACAGKRCEPTYEELKPWKSAKEAGFMLMLRAYLRGIETHLTE